MSGDKYFVRFRGQVTGPFTREKLLTNKRLGEITAVHNISSDGTTWSMAKDVDWLFPPPAAPKKPLPVGDPVEQPVPVAPVMEVVEPRRRPSASLVFAGTFLVTVLVAMVAVYFVQQARRQAALNATTQPIGGTLVIATAPDPLNTNRMDRHVCQVICEELAEIPGPNGSRKVVYVPEDGWVSSGSGFVVTKDGYIFTNRHVVAVLDKESRILNDRFEVDTPNGPAYRLPNRISVRFNKDELLPAKVCYVSPIHDLAVLKVEATFDQPFAIAPTFTRGEHVNAFGFPGDTQFVATNQDKLQADQNEEKVKYDAQHDGIDLRDMYPASQWLLTQTLGTITTDRRYSSQPAFNGPFIQMSADIRHGNSGGPLLNDKGEVIGIDTIGYEVHFAKQNDGKVGISTEGVGMNIAYDVRAMLPDVFERVPELKDRMKY